MSRMPITAHASALFTVILCVLLLTTCGLRSGAQVTVTSAFVARTDAGEKTAPDNDHLTDIVRLKANADSKSGITRVLFEVDEQFRAEAKTPPYLYEWDTLDENDGQHTVTITAYNANGQTGVQRLKVGVENQLKLGVAHYVKVGLEAFQVSDLIALDKASRKALKISNRDHDSLRLFALSQGMKGDANRGFQILDDQQNGIPKEAPFTLKVRGYLLMARGLNAPNTFAMVPDLKAGLELARQQVVVDLEATKAKYPEDANDYTAQLARGDALFAHSDYEPALNAYERARKLAPGEGGQRRARQRGALCLLRLGRMQEADAEARKLAQSGDATATGGALYAAVLFHNRKYVAARDAVQSGVAQKNLAALVIASLADLAAGLRAQAYDEARDAVNGADIAETQYAAMAALADAGDQEAARRTFRIAMYRAPLYAPTLIERAYEIMAYDKAGDKWVQALNLLDMVLSGDRDNPAALAGRIAAMMQLKRFTVSAPLFVRFANADPIAPDLCVLRAAALVKGGTETLQSKQLLDRAKILEPLNYQDFHIPTMDVLVARMARLRRVAPFTPYLLDVADGLVTPPSALTKPNATRTAAK